MLHLGGLGSQTPPPRYMKIFLVMKSCDGMAKEIPNSQLVRGKPGVAVVFDMENTKQNSIKW